MSRETLRRSLAIGAVALLAGAAAPAGASALTLSAGDTTTVVVPTAADPHEACVTSATTGAVCQQFPGGPNVTATASPVLSATVTLPAISNVTCPGAFVTSVSTGSAALTGGLTLSGYLLPATTIPLTTSLPADTVSVSHCTI